MRGPPRTGRRPASVGVAVAAIPLAGNPALALNPELDISQIVHMSWKMSDGFIKGAVSSIAQTADGYLWLRMEFGAVRFDGVRPVPWQPSGQALPSS